ncbi:acyltransferase family protein [Iodobacter fluviatilis]|uniref:Fucose 4-O-acetylase-like acetyltransferase n=1 Tax=Iodobacter fluviatilis TaxID=537 RepID=A0A377Q7V7_9NEIS|nr:acyltransferase [Iodobacter fluviatilis]TCU81499.1 fucose 4-O-acetylase-like acetyltransferase [Iodobacter fluviatilis]STQ89931.1 Predicted membrane protein [Iodobacter fluviatilis]
MSHNYRDDWVDYAKGIGILLVVYGHVIRGLIKAGLAIHLSELNFIDAIIYGFHMPLFFFLSGYLFIQSAQRWNSKKLFFNKIDSILYVYIIWSLIQGAVEVMLSRYTNAGIDGASVLSLFWEPRAHFWFLYALFFIFIFIIYFKDWIVKNITITFVCSLLILFFLPLTKIAAIDLPAHFIVFFVFGMLIKQNAKFLRVNKWMMVIYLAFAVFTFLLARTIHESDIINRMLMFVYSLSCILLLSSFCIGIGDKYGFIMRVGQASLAIYLIHVIVGSGARIALNKFFGIQNFYILFIAGLITSVLMPMFVWHYAKRNPIKFLFIAPYKFGR